MAQEQLDPFKIFEGLKNKIVGIDPKTQKEPAGFFVTLNAQPEPISKEDFDNPVLLSGIPAKPYTKDTSGMTEEQINDDKVDYLRRSVEARRKINDLVDKIPEINPQYQNIYGTAKISTAWQAILRGATGVSETKQLDAKTQAALDSALKILFVIKDGVKEPSPQFIAYRKYKAIYDAAVETLSAKYGDAVKAGPKELERWQRMGKVYQSQVKDAENDWESFGFKTAIENALFTQSSQGVDPSAFLISLAKDEYEKYEFAIGEDLKSPFIEISPSNWYDNDSDGWMNYNSKISSSENSTATSDKETKVNASYYFFAHARYSDSSKNGDIKIEASSLEVSCMYKTVHINYGWLDAVLLRMGGWFLMGDHDKYCISDGTTTQKSTDARRKDTELFLPCIPTQIILIKDLIITCKFSEDTTKTLETVRKGGGGFSIWHFGGGGSKSVTKTSSDHTVDINNQGLSMKGIAVMGYYCAINPHAKQ
jgi:hypothetical protein